MELTEIKGQPEFVFNVIYRDIQEDGDRYCVAECLELPGCVSQGETRKEAEANIQDAIRSCLSVLFDDSVRDAVAKSTLPDLRGISSQSKWWFMVRPRW